MIDDAELTAAVAQRSHWQLDDQGAVYAPPEASSHVRIRPVAAPARARERYLVSIIQGQAAVHSAPMATAVAAVAWGERRNLA